MYRCVSATLYGVQNKDRATVESAADMALTRLSQLRLIDTVSYDHEEALTLTILGVAVYKGNGPLSWQYLMSTSASVITGTITFIDVCAFDVTINMKVSNLLISMH